MALESTFRFIWPPGRDSFKTGMRASIFHNVCFKQQHLFQMCDCHFKAFSDYFTIGEWMVSGQAWEFTFSTIVASSRWVKEGTLPVLWRPTQRCRGPWGAAMSCPCQRSSLPQEHWSTAKRKTAEQRHIQRGFVLHYFGLPQGQKCNKKDLTEELSNSQVFTPVFVQYLRF